MKPFAPRQPMQQRRQQQQQQQLALHQQQQQQQQQPGSELRAPQQQPQPQQQQWQQPQQQQWQQPQQPGAPQAPQASHPPLSPSFPPAYAGVPKGFGDPNLPLGPWGSQPQPLGYGGFYHGAPQPQPWLHGPLLLPHPGPQVAMPMFQHAMTMQGLSGAGKKSVARLMQFHQAQMLSENGAESKQPEANNYNVFRGHSFGVNAYGGRCAMPMPRLLPTARAIVLVVDSCNRAVLTPSTEGTHQPPLSSVKQKLEALLQQNKLARLPLLVLANKQDKEGAMSTEEIARLLDLAALDGVRDWRIAGCNALTGEGLAPAFQWLNVVIAAPTIFRAAVPTKDILGILGPANTNDAANTTADVTAAELLAAAKAAAPQRPTIPANAVEQPTVVEEAAVPRAA